MDRWGCVWPSVCHWQLLDLATRIYHENSEQAPLARSDFIIEPQTLVGAALYPIWCRGFYFIQEHAKVINKEVS